MSDARNLALRTMHAKLYGNVVRSLVSVPKGMFSIKARAHFKGEPVWGC